MSNCDHKGSKRYARRVFSNGTVHYCVQCSICLDAIKTHRHGHRLFIRHDEIPPNATIHEWLTPPTDGGLFDE